MVSNATERSSNIQAAGSWERIDELHFLWREELSSDLFCVQTDTDCLIYGYEYVPTATLQPLI